MLATLSGIGCSWCTRSTPPPTDRPLTIIYSTAVTGNLEPCGCSADQRGGVARAAQAIDEILKEGRPVLVIDGGDRFFPATPVPTDPLVLAQQQRQARTMADATNLMHYDALVFGARDERGDAQFFSGLPPLLDTGDNTMPFTKPSLLKSVGGVNVGLFAVGAGGDAPALVRSRAAGLRSQGAQIIVLLAYQTFEQAKSLLPAAKEAGVAVVLAGRADVPETHESAALPDSQPPLFTVAARGEELLRIDVLAGGPAGKSFVKVAGQAERDADLQAMQDRIEELRKSAVSLSPLDPMAKLKTEKLLELETRKAKLAAAPPPALPRDQNVFTYAFVPMSPKLPDDPAVRAAINQYDASTAKDNLAYAQAHPKACPAAQAGQPSYVGDQKCAQCHQEAYDFWKTTPHAKAYNALVAKNKQYDVSCIGCHVLGYEKPGGTCDIAQTAGRENVQCESCHGPGSTHAESEDPGDIKLEVPEAQCRTCHDPENSTHFNYATYRPQILGPGHGTKG